MSHKQFAERLNKELDVIGVPPHFSERVEIFSKLIHIPKFKAEAFLNGIYIPNEETLKKLANEFEVTPEWLIGTSERRGKVSE